MDRLVLFWWCGGVLSGTVDRLSACSVTVKLHLLRVLGFEA